MRERRQRKLLRLSRAKQNLCIAVEFIHSARGGLRVLHVGVSIIFLQSRFLQSRLYTATYFFYLFFLEIIRDLKVLLNFLQQIPLGSRVV